ncbi:MAG: hypothetical protein ACFB6R_03770 [Alphaproteobacteria bacterium]
MRRQPFRSTMVAATALCGIYYFALAAPLYVSEARFAIRSNESPGPDPLLAGLVGQTSGTVQESIAIRDFIGSHDMVKALDARLDLRSLYSAPRLDPFRQLSVNASDEDFLEFFVSLVSTTIDREANIVTLDVQSFTPETAHAIATSILDLSETFINDLSSRVREATVSTARMDVEDARAQVTAARVALARFRNRTGDLNPVASGSGALQAVMGLEQEVTRLRADLASMRTISQDASPQVQQLKARILALEGQIGEQRAKLAGADQGGTLAESLITYEELLVEHEYADRRLISALTALDTARALAEKRQRFLVRIVNPNLPMEATEPRRVLSFILTLILIVVAYGIISFTIAGINDHRGVA